jgi:hypothetical protein
MTSGLARKRNRMTLPDRKNALKTLKPSSRAELIDAAAQDITAIFTKKARLAANKIVDIANQSGDLREALKAATKIVEFIVPPVKAPLVAIQNMPTFVSHLGVPPPPAAIETVKNTRPPLELPASELPPKEKTRILPEQAPDRAKFSEPLSDFTRESVDIEKIKVPQ